MKTGIIVVLAAAVATLLAVVAHGGTPAKARQPADPPPPSYAASAHLGCAYYPGGGGRREWIPGPCTNATGSAMVGQPDGYQVTVTNPTGRAEPVPDVTVGFYGAYGLITTARESLPAGRIAPRHAVRVIYQNQPAGTAGVRVLAISGR